MKKPTEASFDSKLDFQFKAYAIHAHGNQCNNNVGVCKTPIANMLIVPSNCFVFALCGHGCVEFSMEQETALYNFLEMSQHFTQKPDNSLDHYTTRIASWLSEVHGLLTTCFKNKFCIYYPGSLMTNIIFAPEADFQVGVFEVGSASKHPVIEINNQDNNTLAALLKNINKSSAGDQTKTYNLVFVFACRTCVNPSAKALQCQNFNASSAIPIQADQATPSIEEHFQKFVHRMIEEMRRQQQEEAEDVNSNAPPSPNTKRRRVNVVQRPVGSRVEGGRAARRAT